MSLCCLFGLILAGLLPVGETAAQLPPDIQVSACGATCPVENVSWDDAQAFIAALNRQEGVETYRLPTEAEWEHTARARTQTAYYFGDEAARLGVYAWYADSSDTKTHPVGQKRPNGWGLYDMHGNAWEWVQDWYGAYPRGAVTDPLVARVRTPTG